MLWEHEIAGSNPASPTISGCGFRICNVRVMRLHGVAPNTGAMAQGQRHRPAGSEADGALLVSTRFAVAADATPAFESALRDFYTQHSAEWIGNFSQLVGFARTARTSDRSHRAEVLAVSGWESAEALRRARDGPVGRYAMTGPLAPFLAPANNETWELVDQVANSFDPAAASVLRTLRVQLAPGAEPEFLRRAVPLRDEALAAGDIVLSQLGRRNGPDGPVLLFVNTWRDEAALGRQAGPLLLFAWNDLPRELVRGKVEIDTFAVWPVRILRLTPDGPPVVVTDDGGRIVDVTPAACALLGLSSWDLLDRRLADLGGRDHDAALLPSGRLVLPRPEGGSVVVQVRGAWNLPVPGRHALLLRPATEEMPSDSDVQAAIDRAFLSDARPVGRVGEARSPNVPLRVPTPSREHEGG